MSISTDNLVASQVSFATCMEKVYRGLEQVGSIPIFSASVNRIRFMSSSDETEVIELANEIMKDASLTSKLLRVVNSSQYNHSGVKITTISRAIVILGYETVKSITLALKVIDSFQFEHASIDVNSLLAKSFMSAGFVKVMAIKTGVKDPEESYICALLHNLGEIIVATILSSEYEQIMVTMKTKEISWEKAQQTILGTTFKEIAQTVFKKWEFPDTVVKTVESYSNKNNGPVKNKLQLNKALASISNDIVGTIYSPETVGSNSYNDLMADLSEATGLEKDSISSCLTDSFKASCDLIEDYGLNRKALQPKIASSDGSDPARDKIARVLSYYAGNKQPNSEEDSQQSEVVVSQTTKVDSASSEQGSEMHVPESPEATEFESKQEKDALTTAAKIDHTVIISILNEITNLILVKSDINSILSKILEGINRGVGFDRAVLCFLSPDKKRYKGRLGAGAGVEELTDYFSFSVNVTGDLFSQTMVNGGELLVKDVNNAKWQHLLPPGFREKVNVTEFVVASLKLGDKPIGFFYADTAIGKREITSEYFSGFTQFVIQSKLALGAR